MSQAKKKIAIFPGTFDPFTAGHANVVKRALKMFDEIVIAIGFNANKRTFFTVEQRIRMIQKYYASDQRIRVEAYDILTVDFAVQIGADHIIRGIRTVADMEYERTIADVNLKISGIDTLLLFTLPELTSVSSSICRELLRFGKDISMMLPDSFELEDRE